MAVRDRVGVAVRLMEVDGRASLSRTVLPSIRMGYLFGFSRGSTWQSLLGAMDGSDIHGDATSYTRLRYARRRPAACCAESGCLLCTIIICQALLGTYYVMCLPYKTRVTTS